MARCARCTTRWRPSAAASARPSRPSRGRSLPRCPCSRGRFLKQHPAVPLCGEGAKAARTPAMPLIVKICGLKTPEALDVALESGADLVGFVFFAPSPRHLGLPAARLLGERVSGRAGKVALTVDADDETLSAIVASLKPDMLQLHGSEPPERVTAVRALWPAGDEGGADRRAQGPGAHRSLQKVGRPADLRCARATGRHAPRRAWPAV